MNWSWELRPASERELKKLDRKSVASVLDALDRLTSEMAENGRPAQSDTKKLRGLENQFRLRVGSYRIRYEVEFRENKSELGELSLEGVIVVIHVLNRREAY